jgi:alginate O-acetyltransferase complex protein AlgJ
LPVPVKAGIEPATLSTRRVAVPLGNRSRPELLKKLADSKVRVLDLGDLLAAYAKEHGNAYLTTDTHWLPGAVQAVAQRLAEEVVDVSPDLRGTTTFSLQPQRIGGEGDIARMFTLPTWGKLYRPQEVEIWQVLAAGTEFWQPNRNAKILLLGDSFTNIYSAANLGWGSGAGLAELLSHALGEPIDLLARNDSGAYVTREMLAGELARGRDRLAGKRLVIWQFAERELVLGDWRPVALRLGEAKVAGFYTAPVGSTKRVTGTVAAISRSPRPGTVPYRDNLLTLHLVDVREVAGEAAAAQALVYGWGMRDNQLTALAALRPGDLATFDLAAWEAVESEYGSYRRTALDEEALELETPNWGSLIDESK